MSDEQLRHISLSVVAAALNKSVKLRQCITNGLNSGVTDDDFYEAFLQIYLFAGFPAAIEALTALFEIQKSMGTNISARNIPIYDVREYTERGETLCKQIYTSAYDKMRKKFAEITPDLGLWMIIEGYGKTISRDGLPIITRELLIVAILSALGWRNQLFSHLRGAINVGATAEECAKIIKIVAPLCTKSRIMEANNALDIIVRRLRNNYD